MDEKNIQRLARRLIAENTESKIIDFFINHETVNDSDVHKLSESLGINPHDFEGIIYKILSSFLSRGKSKGKMPEAAKNMSKEEMDQAIQVEMEHTDNPDIAKKIVYDHITELGPDYYKALAKMEASLKK